MEELRKREFLTLFSSFQSYLDKDQDVREKINGAVRNLEKTTRCILAILQAVHHSPQKKNISAICQQAEEMFGTLKSQFSELILLIPAGQYYRFHDQWRFVSQRAAFLASFLVYLKSDKLITRKELAGMLGIKVNREEGFHIDLDDFLTGLLLLANELSRLAVNCVTAEEYERPQNISSFVSELDAGFRLLNLKNDFLRKKFDGLKYDLKKIEEVVYDIKIRCLIIKS
ncbi:translin-like [Dendronephthya gigantea]|uniref:translin-like n=1 Tax=Dendronephthya gigantea TaxID=151771 RepID=UPI00106B873C|nr:translin-like [Dendronephthya gigantea]